MPTPTPRRMLHVGPQIIRRPYRPAVRRSINLDLTSSVRQARAARAALPNGQRFGRVGGGVDPALIVEPFGVNAGADYIQNPIPVPSQIPTNPGRASYADGFPPDCFLPIGSGGYAVDGADMNGILFALSSNIAGITGGQQYPFSSTFSTNNDGYAQWAIIGMAAGNGWWLNTMASNTNDPDTTSPPQSSGWVPLVSVGPVAISGLTTGTVTLTAVQASYPTLQLSGTLTGTPQLVFPSWAGWRWRIINNCTAPVNVQTSGGTQVVVPAFGSAGYTDIWSDGTNLRLGGYYAIGSFTGTLTGVSGTVTGTLSYIVNGREVWVETASGTSLLGTSNADTCTITGQPAFLYPPSSNTENLAPCSIIIAGNSVSGAALLAPSYVALYLGAVSGTALNYNSTAFPTSGSKGVSAWQAGWPYY